MTRTGASDLQIAIRIHPRRSDLKIAKIAVSSRLLQTQVEERL